MKFFSPSVTMLSIPIQELTIKFEDYEKKVDDDINHAINGNNSAASVKHTQQAATGWFYFRSGF